jgi:aspartyl-tRNA(Asn)/glutamyl-tRNA(Gln) amidotransferase subunit B
MEHLEVSMSSTKNNYQLVCGLEIHAELKTNSKMFCACKNDPFHAEKPNIYTCPVCLGMPGGLPVANKKAIEWTIMLGLSLNCKINLFSKFDRKNYFYPDLPKGYQISQYDIPFCYDGYIDTSEGRVRINRIHLEEDTGKLQHTTLDGKKVSLVDFNRSGVPLVEIVTEADIKTPSQAKEYGKKIRQRLRYLQIADCDMEQGGMRLEANISIKKPEEKGLPNYKVEVKNINSFRFMEQAVEYEMERHEEMLENGETPIQETRGWNPNKNETFSQRTKEDAEDYRYFPDPDIPPLRFTKVEIDTLEKQIPELYEEKVARWEKEFGIEKRYGEMLAEDAEEAAYFEAAFVEVTKQKQKANKLANLVVNKKITVNFNDKPEKLVQTFIAETSVEEVDSSELEAIIAKVIAENPNEVAAYKAGKDALINFFVGQTMRALKKKIDVNQIKELLVNALIA